MSNNDTARLITPDSKFEFDAGSTVIVDHYDECGTPQTMIVGFVQVSNDRGERWSHRKSFEQAVGENSNEVDARVLAVAAKFLARWKEGWTPEDNSHWWPARAVWGSDAYFDEGWADSDLLDERDPSFGGEDISYVH